MEWNGEGNEDREIDDVDDDAKSVMFTFVYVQGIAFRRVFLSLP